jgi:hypothetical protein
VLAPGDVAAKSARPLVGMSMLLAVLVRAPATILVPLVVIVGATSLAWNGLSFTATAELAGRQGSGSALGVQQTALDPQPAVQALRSGRRHYSPDCMTVHF